MLNRCYIMLSCCTYCFISAHILSRFQASPLLWQYYHYITPTEQTTPADSVHTEKDSTLHSTQADPAQLTAQPVGLSSGTGKFFSISIYTSKGYNEIFFIAVENETYLLPPG
jgi:hypothetical protein